MIWIESRPGSTMATLGAINFMKESLIDLGGDPSMTK